MTPPIVTILQSIRDGRPDAPVHEMLKLLIDGYCRYDGRGFTLTPAGRDALNGAEADMEADDAAAEARHMHS